MTVHMFVVPLSTELKAGDRVLISGDEAKHAISVRRIRMSETVQVTDGLGRRAIGEVCELGQRELSLVISEVQHQPEPDLKITLVQALAKGDRDELAVQACTELGVSEVTPWQAERCISRWDDAKATKGVARWLAIATEATKQSLQTRIPQVRAPLSTAQLAKVVSDFDMVLVLDPTASVGIGAIELPASGRLALIVGPEGGISTAELASLETAGAVRVHLGDSVLRTSTAGVAALAIIRANSGLYN